MNSHPRIASNNSIHLFSNPKIFWLLAVVAIFLLGSWLRVNDLGAKSLWDDELFSADIVLNRPLFPTDGTPFFQSKTFFEMGTNESFWTVKAADQSPPGYELVSKLVVSIFGDSEAGLRATSAIAAAILLAWLGARAIRNSQHGTGSIYLMMMALCAASGMMYSYSQEARAYNLGALFTGIIFVLFFERILQSGKLQSFLDGAKYLY